MNISGTYARLTYDKDGTPQSPWLIPYGDEFSLSTKQEFIQPVQKVFNEMKEALISVENNTGFTDLAVGTKLITDLSDIFGIKFFGKYYYASAWTGTQPSTFSIKLNFFRGMTGATTWSAYSEVYTKIQEIISYTVPRVVGDTTLTAPAPNTIGVFTTFAESIIDSAESTLKAAYAGGKALLGGKSVTSAVVSKLNSQIESSSNTLVSALKTPINTWTLEIGHSDTGITLSSPFIKFSNLVVEGSSLSYSPQLARNSNGGYYPISGTLELMFKTQTILGNTDFYSLTKA